MNGEWISDLLNNRVGGLLKLDTHGPKLSKYQQKRQSPLETLPFLFH